jgi:hypothetical protein
MDPTLRLHPDQQELTSTQEAEARRFADEFIRRQLSTDPVDELAAEAFLCQAYEVAGLAPPQHLHWLDGPLHLDALLAAHRFGTDVGNSVVYGVQDRVRTGVRQSLWEHVWDSVGNHISYRVVNRVGQSIESRLGIGVVPDAAWSSVRAYEDASLLAVVHFFATYLAPNEVHALIHFTTLVSGYCLSRETALVVRRPTLLCLDAAGDLHSATGQCVTYADGWGSYAWHGVFVPEPVILAPETLARDDFVNAKNVEVRRVIQEQMGEQFMSKLGGVVLDSGPRGTLYEVSLPEVDLPEVDLPEVDLEEDSLEEVVRYIQLRDASTDRSYFLRVPPTVQTAAEAVAWSFELSVETYHPAQET